MPVPFQLDVHPRRPQPLLSEPPAGYFDQLPTQVMSRLPQARPASSWLETLAPAWRTALASAVVLSGFGAAFWLGAATATPAVATSAALDAVPRTELADYLLTSGTPVDNADLAALLAGRPELTQGFLQASAEELRAAAAEQPDEEVYF